MIIKIRHDSGLEIELTYANTVINMFGNPELNHVEVIAGHGRRIGFYDQQQLMDDLHEAGFPVYTRSDSPDWAVDRWLNSHPQVALVEEHLT